MTESLTSHLNTHQAEAVTSDAPHLLIVAGAGSGKTRVLVHRIAWLVETGRARLGEVLAVTFTNKAASEIKERVGHLLQTPPAHLWVGTFHSQCHKILRTHHTEANLDMHFQVMDSEEQLRLIKKIHKELNLSDTIYPPKKTQYLINHCKENFQHACDLSEDQHERNFIKAYDIYEKYCQMQSLLDFTDLILKCYELLQNNEQVRQLYQTRFKYILIDEFQDTNRLQYAWLLLIGKTSSLTAVGDDDQSIYSWRGAIVGHLHDFQSHFKNTHVIRLEQNYRSTSTILNAANALIENNHDRMGKNLWTDQDQGELIKLYCAHHERDEANYITECIEQKSVNEPLESFAIFYRSNAQSRILEETLNGAGIPYRIWGGFRFFDRAEIKDCLAYLRLWLNPNDDGAFERVVNLPSRGIGTSTMDKVRLHARENSLSLWQSVQACIDNQLISARAINALEIFRAIITHVQSQDHQHPSDLMDALIDASALKSLYPNRSLEHIGKLENMDELITALGQFNDPESSIQDNVHACLTHMTLDTTASSDNQHSVQLMTFHAAKGLEFNYVFMSGLEEGLFPHFNSSQNEEDLEEERRLCYVGMTRARKCLTITHAQTRRIFGKEQLQRPSRFLGEVPKKYLQTIRAEQNYMAAPIAKSRALSNGLGGFRLGSRVLHESFGEGTILNMEGDEDNLRIQVHFEKHGVKWLLSQYANLTSV
ncbi:UvrD-helicase domain-containing protein [Gammaproteobacteria bacterium]|nr:UvrD-helicase domain-containing protein [Gammaproteobacteria bacterium]